MPCDIGYRIYAPIRIPEPVPLEFKSKNEAPKIDAELLERLGETDPDFNQALEAMDVIPLLKEALKRTLAKIKVNANLRFQISDTGYLEAKASFTSQAQKAQLEKLTAEIAGQFQLEVMKIIAEILDYQLEVIQSKDSWEIIGEKDEEADVHSYLKISKSADGRGELCFEHFKTPKAADLENDKLVALLQKCGIALKLGKARKAGQPINTGTIHKDFLPSRNQN